AVDAPKNLVLVLAGGGANGSFDSTIGVAEKIHTCHGRCSLFRPYLTEGGFRFFHSCHRIVPVGGEGVHALGQHDRIGALGILAALILAHEPAGEVERTPSDSFADTFGDESFHAADPSARHLSAGDQHPCAVIDTSIGGIGRIDLDKHVLL